MKTSIVVQNLRCGGCANTITNKLSSLNNISDVKVDVMESTVTFNSLDEAAILSVSEKLKNLGYPSIEDTNSITSKLKSFVSCATGKMSK